MSAHDTACKPSWYPESLSAGTAAFDATLVNLGIADERLGVLIAGFDKGIDVLAIRCS